MIGMDKLYYIQKYMLFLKIVLLIVYSFANCQHPDTQQLSASKYEHYQTLNHEKNILFQEQSQIFRKLLHNDSQNSSFMQLYLKYEEVVQKINDLDAIVKTLFQQVTNTKLIVAKNIKELSNEQQDFNQIIEDLEIVNILDSSEDISDLRTRFIEANKQLQKTTDKCAQSTQQLYEQQKQFEEELTELKKQERNLIDIGNELQTTAQNMFMVTQFNTTKNFLSQKYIPQQQNISENQLESLFNLGVVRNVAVSFGESSEIYKDVNLKGEVKIQRLQIVNSKNGIKYFRLNFQDENSSLIIADSKFQGVGLRVDGYDQNSNVQITNFEVKNAPNNGIWIKNCDTFSIKKSLILNSGVDGIEIDQVNNCTLDAVIVRDSKSDGIEISSRRANIKNSNIQNSLHYGISVDSGVVTASNVTFGGNSYGDVNGNYKTN
eukprot:TRINITY_DN21014_c1_g1_i1.p1 TRINITY_DN21014_c1_g1~~TRINITY_DN21014_c1_g1_i1.p1  ORF type:complete len:433 (-),score=42.44 TRINITY_DN21014_c1_g1_i1:209-1507(-)